MEIISNSISMLLHRGNWINLHSSICLPLPTTKKTIIHIWLDGEEIRIIPINTWNITASQGPYIYIYIYLYIYLEPQTTIYFNGCFNKMMNQIFILENGWKSPFSSISINGHFFWGSRYTYLLCFFLFYPLVKTFHHPFNSPSQPGPARSPRRPHPPFWTEKNQVRM